MKVTTQADAWPADPGITSEVTPLQAKIVKNSNMPVVLAYSNFAVVTPEGEYHAVIPPFGIQGKVEQLGPAQTCGTVEPVFVYEDYAIAPIYGPVYDLMSNLSYLNKSKGQGLARYLC